MPHALSAGKLAALACQGLALAALLAACRPPAPEPTPAPGPAPGPRLDGRKVLLMHYMPWYETPSVRGRWGSHWKGHQSEHNPAATNANGLPDIWSHYHPLIGLYDSSDPRALECHLLQMKLAGVNGVVVDWYGLANEADYPPIHAATRAMFDAAGRYGMSFSVCYEDRSLKLLVDWGKLKPADVPAQLADTVKWMESAWFRQPQYFRLRGRPLVLNFGPLFVKDPAVWRAALESASDRPAFHGLHHLWRAAGGDGGFTWVHWEPWQEHTNPADIQARLRDIYTGMSTDPDRLIVSAYPGFNDVYQERHRELPHRDGETLRESLAVCMDGPWRVIQLVTWNDYGEGTMFEPTHEFGYRFLEIVQDARRTEMGAAFPFTSDDLRLPARLYALRLRGDVPRETLDAIARQLSDGDCAGARRALDSLATR